MPADDAATDPARDAARLDWLEANACRVSCQYRRGWVVTLGYPFGTHVGRTLRDAVDAAMAATGDREG